jgi:hypothetical protein
VYKVAALTKAEKDIGVLNRPGTEGWEAVGMVSTWGARRLTGSRVPAEHLGAARMEPVHVGLVADPASPTEIARGMGDLDPPGGGDGNHWGTSRS